MCIRDRVYWVWCPIHFDGFSTHFLTREEPDGHPSELGGAIIKTYTSMDEIPKGADALAGEEAMATARHKIQWQSGTRWPKRAELELEARDGTRYQLELEPLLRFHMMGIGYQHAEWKHAMWRDELDIGYESWVVDELDPEDYGTIHVHNLVRGKMGEKVGVGILETLCYGRHEPSGFQDFFDGAP